MSATINIGGNPGNALAMVALAQAAINSLEGKTVNLDIDWDDPASVESWAVLFEQMGHRAKAAELRRVKAEYDRRRAERDDVA